MTISINDIARVCHEANRAYIYSIPNGFKSDDWDEGTEEQRASVISGVEAVIDNPILTPEQSHEKWVTYKKAEGWVFGERKDEATKTHPNLLPWDELPSEEKVKDVLFQAVVRALVR